MKSLAILSMWAAIVAINIVMLFKVENVGSLVVACILIVFVGIATIAIVNPKQ